MTVAAQQRHSKRNRCPVCGGCDQDPRDVGKRCHGFTSRDGKYAHCSREDHANGLHEEEGGTFAHKLHGDCNCGEQHGAPDDTTMQMPKIEAAYDYTDEHGAPLYQVVRLCPKDFRQRRRDGAGGWIWKLGDVRRVPYRLPALLAASADAPVYVTEGEKDADALSRLGHVATTNPGGAGKFHVVADAARTALRGRDILIIADADAPGRKHAIQVEASLRSVARSLLVMECPAPHKDVSDLIAAGGDLTQLIPMQVGATPLPTTPTQPASESSPERLHLTDAGNAARFARDHGADVRFVAKWSAWLVWDGTRWVVDDANVHVTALAMETAKRIYVEASAEQDNAHRALLAKWAMASEGGGHLDTMVKLAKSMDGIAITHDQLDADPWVLNVSNGTLDLRTGTLRPHDRADLCTKLAPVAYDPTATCTRFELFMGQVTDADSGLVAFLQCFLGYSLTGDTREHVLAFWYGTGCNGKSLLALVLLFLMGDYAAKAAPDLLLRSEHTDRHPTELADLHAKRLVICNETTRGRSWDEGTVKDVTGGDRIKARRMRENFWEFEPSHKLVVFGNHKPRIESVDEAMKRRLRLVPFAVNFESEKDTGLLDKLKAEAPGILRWLVDGCLAWQRSGLPVSQAVSEATKGYFADEDAVGRFLGACCHLGGPNDRVTRKRLRDAYEGWSADAGEPPVTAKVLAAALAARGVTAKTVRTSVGPRDGWAGVRLQEEEGADGAA